jgi:hypothetical protein
VKVGDLVREKTRMERKPWMGVILKIDYTQNTGGLVHPYQVRFFDGETDWMKEGFLEVVSESR